MIWAFHLLSVQGISILCASATLKIKYHCTTHFNLVELRGGCTLRNPSQAACSSTALQLGEELICGLGLCFYLFIFLSDSSPLQDVESSFPKFFLFPLDMVWIACVLRFQLDEMVQVCSLAFIQASGCFRLLVVLCNSSSAHP